MAIENIPINSGTGPKVAVDLVGDTNYQVVKLMTATDGSTGDLFTGTVAISTIATGTVNISGNIATVSNILTVGTLLGTVAVSGGGGGQQYAAGSTAMAVTGTGNMIIALQTGATTGRSLVVTTTGALVVAFVTTQAVTAANITVASVTTGTMNVVNVLSAANITVASVTTGTMNVVNVLSAANVTVASVTTGTMNVINVLSATGVLLGATTANAGAFVRTAHASNWNAYVVVTGSANTIVKTSGAHTLYVTDLMVSVDVPMTVKFFSAATTKCEVYLATKGGFVFPMSTPLALNTAQSLTFTPLASGSAVCYAAGYTVT